jgi:SAM-dependent methyltransferase
MAIASAVRNKNRKAGANAVVTGVDTSPEMLAMARARDLDWRGIDGCLSQTTTDCRNATADDFAADGALTVRFVEANAEGTPFSKQSFDLVTIMYVLHEAPFLGRHRILREARRLLKPGGILAVVDIAPGYEPSGSMLSGEPYLKDYQRNLAGQLSSLRGFEFEFESERALCKDTIVVPGHVVLYSLVKSPVPWWKRLSSNGWIQRATEFANVHSYVWNRLLSSSEERPE